MKGYGQINTNIIIFIALAIVIFLVVSLGILHLFPLTLLILLVGFVACLFTFVNTNFGLMIIIFSMLLSPEFEVFSVGGERTATLRIEDVIIIMVFFTWLAKLAINKELGMLKKTALNKPMVCYIFIFILATLVGVIKGYAKIYSGLFFALKYIEYYMIYFLVANNLNSKKQAEKFIALILITAVITCLYGYSQIGVVKRISGPFEGYGEPNTLGGYLVFIIALTLSLFAHSRSFRNQIIFASLIIFLFMPIFLRTYSRGSYLGFIPMWLTLVILAKRKKALLFVVLIFGILFSPLLLPVSVKARIMETFVPGHYFAIAGRKIGVDDSTATRALLWRLTMEEWPKNPFLGKGLTGAGLIDTEIPRVLLETGIIGLGIFFWLLGTLFRTGLQNLRCVNDSFATSLIVGFLAGFVGLLFHGFSASTFVIVRIMEPFWFLAGIVVMLPEVITSERS